MLQQAIVAVMVALATWVVLRKYLPVRLRRRLAGSAGRVLHRAGLTRAASWMETDLPAAASCGDGCGTCGSCGTDTKASGAVQPMKFVPMPRTTKYPVDNDVLDKQNRC